MFIDQGALQPREAEEANPGASTHVREDARKLHKTITNAAMEATADQGDKDGRGLAPPRRRRPKLRQLNANDVNAVFAEGQRAVNSLRDVQVIAFS